MLTKFTYPYLMKKTLLMTGIGLAFSANVQAQTLEPTIDEKIEAAVAPTAQFISDIIFYEVQVAGAGIPLILVWLLVGALFFTVYLGFINVRGFKYALD